MSARQLYFQSFDARWLILGFSVVAATAILSIIPAIRQGHVYVAKNGTPWDWPMFPFSVFVLLGVGLCGRLALLSMSFDPTSGSGSILGSYLYVPIFLATLIVLLEIGIVQEIEGLTVSSIMAAPFAILLAMNWDMDDGQLQFINKITFEFGAPIWLTMIALIGLFSMARWRKVAGAGFLLTGASIAAIVFDRDGLLVSEFSQISVWPCCLLAGMQLASKDQRRRSGHWFVASVWMSPVVARIGESATSEGLGLPIGLHGLVIAALLIGFSFKDRFALQLRIAVAVCLPLLAMTFWLSSFTDSRLEPWTVLYAVALAALSFAVYRWFNDSVYYCAAVSTVVVALLASITKLQPHVDLANRRSALLLAKATRFRL